MPVRPSAAWLVGFGLSLAATCASLFVTVAMATAFLRPHAFGARDGQGAAGLAAVILLGGAVSSLVSAVVLGLVTRQLRARFGVAWPWKVAVFAPLGVVGFAMVASLLG